MDFRRTREAALHERQQKVLAVRCHQLLSKEEAAFRQDITSDHAVLLNRMRKDFVKGLIVLAYYNLPPLPGSGAAEAVVATSSESAKGRPVPQRGARRGPKAGAAIFSTDTDLSCRIKKTAAMYDSGPERFRGIRTLHRAHYQHPLPAHATVQILPPVPPYELRLVAVKEAGEREDVAHAEGDDRERVRRHMRDVIAEARAREQRLLAAHQPNTTRPPLGGSSPSRLAPEAATHSPPPAPAAKPKQPKPRVVVSRRPLTEEEAILKVQCALRQLDAQEDVRRRRQDKRTAA